MSLIFMLHSLFQLKLSHVRFARCLYVARSFTLQTRLLPLCYLELKSEIIQRCEKFKGHMETQDLKTEVQLCPQLT